MCRILHSYNLVCPFDWDYKRHILHLYTVSPLGQMSQLKCKVVPISLCKFRVLFLLNFLPDLLCLSFLHRLLLKHSILPKYESCPRSWWRKRRGIGWEFHQSLPPWQRDVNFWKKKKDNSFSIFQGYLKLDCQIWYTQTHTLEKTYLISEPNRWR